MISGQHIAVTAEQFELVCKAYCADKFASHSGTGLVSVKTTTYGGYLYSVFGVGYQPWSEVDRPKAWAFRLEPESMYDGETTSVYHDEEAICTGQRKRGDLTGLIVLVKGQRMVCSKAVTFEKGLPDAAPISLEEAKACDKQGQVAGWRALFHKGEQPEWYAYEGHPVSVYGAEQGDKAITLFWRYRRQIQEMRLNKDVELCTLDHLCSVASTKPISFEQMSLF